MSLPYFVICRPESDCREALLLLRRYARREVGILQLRRVLGGRSRRTWGDMREFAEILVDVVQAMPSYRNCVAQKRGTIVNADRKKMCVKKMRMISLYLPVWLLQELDAISQEMGISRSELIRQILVDYVLGRRG